MNMTATAPQSAGSANKEGTPFGFDIQDIELAKSGKAKIDWAQNQVPVLKAIRARFEKEQPLKGYRVAACLHVTTETAHLMITLKAGGAEIALCASNPLSTQDDIAASLVKDFGISVFAIRGEDTDTYYDHVNSALSISPHVTMDDGADLVSSVHKNPEKYGKDIIGGTEETTTGVIRLKSLAAEGKLSFPVISVNDADTKHLFDNRYGTGQSTIDGIIRATNQLIAGTTFVVLGYGWCGKGLAQRARGLGAQVVVTEVDPIKGLEAVMDGYQVMPIQEAAKIGDIFVSVTGNTSVIREEHFKVMKDNALVANSGHFDVELDLKALEKLSKSDVFARNGIHQFVMEDGRKINLLGEGRLVNLACAEGHPPGVMDMSFANQALSCEYLLKEGSNMKTDVYPVPRIIDERIAAIKLEGLGVNIDELTAEQKKYLASWEIGT